MQTVSSIAASLCCASVVLNVEKGEYSEVCVNAALDRHVCKQLFITCKCLHGKGVAMTKQLVADRAAAKAPMRTLVPNVCPNHVRWHYQYPGLRMCSPQ